MLNIFLRPDRGGLSPVQHRVGGVRGGAVGGARRHPRSARQDPGAAGAAQVQSDGVRTDARAGRGRAAPAQGPTTTTDARRRDPPRGRRLPGRVDGLRGIRSVERRRRRRRPQRPRRRLPPDPGPVLLRLRPGLLSSLLPLQGETLPAGLPKTLLPGNPRRRDRLRHRRILYAGPPVPSGGQPTLDVLLLASDSDRHALVQAPADPRVPVRRLLRAAQPAQVPPGLPPDLPPVHLRGSDPAAAAGVPLLHRAVPAVPPADPAHVVAQAVCGGCPVAGCERLRRAALCLQAFPVVARAGRGAEDNLVSSLASRRSLTDYRQ